MPAALTAIPQRAGGEPPDSDGFPTREQDEVFEALALDYDTVIAERTSTLARAQCYLATCVTAGHPVVVYAVYPSGLRVQRS